MAQQLGPTSYAAPRVYRDRQISVQTGSATPVPHSYVHKAIECGTGQFCNPNLATTGQCLLTRQRVAESYRTGWLRATSGMHLVVLKVSVGITASAVRARSERHSAH